VPAYAFDTHTNGVRPAKTPMPPRTCWLPPKPGFQLKPTRGEMTGSSFGVTSVRKPGRAAATIGFADGLSGKRGTSARMPRESVTWLFRRQESLT
jgi:hypothetical protein